MSGHVGLGCPLGGGASSSPGERTVSGGHGGGETPVPIPNTAVKPASADGTWGVAPWESRTPPGFLQTMPPPMRGHRRVRDPRFEVVEEGEDPDPTVVPGPGHGGIGAPADVRGIGDDPAVMDPRTSTSGHPLGGEQTGVPHKPEHPVLAHVELVFPAEVGPDLAVALPGEGAVGDHLPDLFGELVVWDLGLWTRSAAESVTSRPAVVDGGPGRLGDPTDGGQGDLHLGTHLGRFCGGIWSPLFWPPSSRSHSTRVRNPSMFRPG